MPAKLPDSLPGRYYSRYALVILLLVGAILAWEAWTSTRNFHDYHKNLAENSVTGGSAPPSVRLHPCRGWNGETVMQRRASRTYLIIPREPRCSLKPAHARRTAQHST